MTILLAPRDYEKGLLWEFPKLKELAPRLYESKNDITSSIWAANIWRSPTYIKFDSVRDGAKKLRDIQRNWVLYSFDLHRRAKLIQSELPHVAAKRLNFPSELPTAPLGSWTLLDNNLILASADCSAAVPNGEYEFNEDKTGSPNRAYLKLWEFFTRYGVAPKRGAHCLDLGASPGGWSLVLASLGAKVTAVDRAPLDPKVSANKLINYQSGSMFSLSPDKLSSYSWIFSDAACEPVKLLEWIKPVAAKNPKVSLLCTIKFKGPSGYEIIREFLKIPGSDVVHLHHNKHEVSWLLLRT
jgi:23S rRNA (cytidine2498-2'-O)-methyltransferase